MTCPDRTEITEPNTGTASATHEEICDQALEHYELLATECNHWSSVVPRAIRFYKQYGPEIKGTEKCPTS